MSVHVLALAASVLLVQTPWGGAMTARQVFDQMDTFGPGEDLTVGQFAEQPGEYAWGESYLLASYVTMYEATGDTRYLDKSVSRFRVLLSLRDDKKGKRDELRGRIIAAWGTEGYSNHKRTCWNVHAGMLTAPAAHFVRLVKERRRLQRRYGAIAKEFTTALEETVASFAPDWRDGPNKDEGYYVEAALNGEHSPLNQQNALGRTLIDLAVVTGKRDYRDKAVKLAAFFKRRLRLSANGAYDWSYWPKLEPPYENGSEDISHAAINAEYALRCYENHIVFTKEDMQRFAATFLKSIYHGDGKFGDTVDGKGDGRFASQCGRWGCLASVNREVARVIHDYFWRQDPPLAGTTTMLALAYLAQHGY